MVFTNSDVNVRVAQDLGCWASDKTSTKKKGLPITRVVSRGTWHWLCEVGLFLDMCMT